MQLKYCPSSATAGAATARTCRQVRCQLKAGTSRGLYKIDTYGLNFLKQFLVDDKLDIPIIENHIFFKRLIQSHAQGGTASPRLQHNPDGLLIFLIFQKFLDHLTCFFCYFKHTFFFLLFNCVQLILFYRKSIFIARLKPRRGFLCTAQVPPKRGTPPRRETSFTKPIETFSPSTITGTCILPPE